MKGRIYRKKLLRERKKERRRKKNGQGKEKTWRPLSFLSPPYPATFPIINPHKCCITPKINQTIQPILSRLANWTIFRREREERRKKKLRKEISIEKIWSHKVASRYFRQPSAGYSSDASNKRFPLASVLEALSSTRFQPFNRDKGLTLTGYIIATKNGVSLFLRWGRERDRREFQV